MTKNEFYPKYKDIIEQNKLDTNEIVAVAFAIIQADKFLDEEEGNAKTLDLDDFVYTLNNDLMLKSILQPTIAIKPNLTKAKEMYEVQLYRLLLDSVMLVMKDNVPKECGLLSPCALKVANLFKWKITRGGEDYATEEECEKVLELLCISDLEESDATDKFYEFLEFLRKVYQKEPVLFCIICADILFEYKKLPIAVDYRKLNLGSNNLFDTNMHRLFEFESSHNVEDSIFEKLVEKANKWIANKKDIFTINVSE